MRTPCDLCEFKPEFDYCSLSGDCPSRRYSVCAAYRRAYEEISVQNTEKEAQAAPKKPA